MAKNQGVITHAEDTGFGEHDLSDLVPTPNRRPQVRPTPANFRGWVLRRLLGLRLLFLWLSLSLFLPFLLFRLFRFLRLFVLLLLLVLRSLLALYRLL